MAAILLVGATGNFGRRIASLLAGLGEAGELRVASRSQSRAEGLAHDLRTTRRSTVVTAARVATESLEACLGALDGCTLCIDNAGPFQFRDLTLLRACAEAGCDYLDLSDDPEYCRRVVDFPRPTGMRIFTSHSTFSATTLLLATELIRRVGTPAEAKSGLVLATHGGSGLGALRSLLTTLDRHADSLSPAFALTYPSPLGRRHLLRYPTTDSIWFREILGLAAVESGIAFTNPLIAPTLLLLRRLGIPLLPLAAPLSFGQSVLARLSRSGALGCLQVWARGNARAIAVSVLAEGTGPDVPCFPAVLTGLRYLAGSHPVSHAGICWLHEWLSWAQWEEFCAQRGVQLQFT
jgi:hypothetical protein